MADFTIASDDQGVYEIAVPANDPVTIDVRTASGFSGGKVQVIVHSGTAPIYVAHGETVTPRNSKAYMFPPMTYADLPLGIHAGGVIALVSEAPAVVSVCRS